MITFTKMEVLELDTYLNAIEDIAERIAEQIPCLGRKPRQKKLPKAAKELESLKKLIITIRSKIGIPKHLEGLEGFSQLDTDDLKKEIVLRA